MKTTPPQDAAQDVHTLLAEYADAVRSLKLEQIVSFFAPDIVAYDAIFQLQFVGRDAYTAHWRECLKHCEKMIFEPRDPKIEVSGDLAAGYYLVKCGGTGPDGQEHIGWMRATFMAKKHEDHWLFTHEHYSMPMDPMTGKILEGLEP